MSLEKTSIDVILLKSNDESDTTKKKDRYIQALEQQSSCPIASNLQINLLKFSYLNSKEIYSRLNNCLVSNETTFASHKCLILTSRQAIESIQAAFDDSLTPATINMKLNESSFSYKENIDEYDIDKTRLIIYCVGDVTKTRFKHFVQEKLLNNHPNVLNDLIVRTPSLGHKQNAKSLANLIIEDYNFLKVKYKEASNRLFSHTYALYPCSSIRKDDLSDELKKNSISLEEIVAYETVQDDLAVMRFYSHLNNFLTKCENRVCCFVFFSPSGCNAVFNFKHEEIFNTKKKILADKSGKFVFISIGPSTSSKLKEFVDEACVNELREPSPEALVEKLTTLFSLSKF